MQLHGVSEKKKKEKKKNNMSLHINFHILVERSHQPPNQTH
jgi:hypothetical protein